MPATASAAAPTVSAHASATARPTTSSTPKPRTIGTGESSSTRIAAELEAPPATIVGAPTVAALSDRADAALAVALAG